MTRFAKVFNARRIVQGAATVLTVTLALTVRVEHLCSEPSKPNVSATFIPIDMTRSDQRQVWAGLASVHQHPGAGVLLDRNDAFVNAVALAHTAEEFTQLVRGALSQLGFELVDLEEIEPLALRRLSFAIPEEMERLANIAQSSVTVEFGAFHTWVSDDDDRHSGTD